VVTDSEREEVSRLLGKARESGAKYALVGNVGHIALAAAQGLIPVGGFRLNIYNRAATETVKELGISEALLSPELTLPKTRDTGGGVIVYGRIPLMITERCFIKENFGCQNCHSAALTDRIGEKFPIMGEFGHRNIILNSQITYMGDKSGELKSHGARHRHMLFTVEDAKEICGAVQCYGEGRPFASRARRIGKR